MYDIEDNMQSNTMQILERKVFYQSLVTNYKWLIIK